MESTSTPRLRAPLVRPSPRGFTLIELMIALAIIAVLAMIALPAYFDSVRKSRRSDAITEIAKVSQAQERWRANNTMYTAALTTAPPGGLGLSATTPGGYYTIATTIPAAPGVGNPDMRGRQYTVTATPTTATKQNLDSCGTLEFRIVDGNATYLAAGKTVEDGVTKRCWAR